MKTLAIACVLTAALFSTAQATVVLSDNFSSENGGATALNYTGFSNFTVVYGSVDLVHNGDGYGISCFSGSACVDLDGSTSTGGFLNSNDFSVKAGQLVTLTAYVSGNQRSPGAAADDDLNLGFTTLGISGVSYANATGPGLPSDPSPAFTLDPAGDGFGFNYDLIAYDAPYQAYTLAFIPAQSGTIEGFIGTDSADNVGPVLGDISLDISAVPEPSVWAMLLAGVGILGLTFRRNRKRGIGLAA